MGHTPPYSWVGLDPPHFRSEMGVPTPFLLRNSDGFPTPHFGTTHESMGPPTHFRQFPAFGNFAAFGDFSRVRRSRHQLFVIFPAKSGESGLGSGSMSSAMKFCIEWSNRELLRPSRRRDMSISLFLSAFGGHAPSFLRFFFLNRANQASGVVPRPPS